MALQVIPRPEASVYEDVRVSPLDRVIKLGTQPQLGHGLVRPFRRDEKNDFANTGGLALIKACVGQVLLTRGANPDRPEQQGELPWNPQFGSLLHLLRHQKNTLVLRELGRIYVVSALRRWEPRVVVKSTLVTESAPNTLLIQLLYDVRANTSSNLIVLEKVYQELQYLQQAA